MTTGNRARRDPAEGRGASRVENRWPDTWEGALNPANLSTKRQRIANLARTKRGAALYSLHRVIDLDWMKEAYRLTRKDGAPGIDGVTAADYEVNQRPISWPSWIASSPAVIARRRSAEHTSPRRMAH